jgi:hypothetical protein
MDSYRIGGLVTLIVGIVLIVIGAAVLTPLMYGGIVVAAAGLLLLIFGESFARIFRFVGGTTGPG